MIGWLAGPLSSPAATIVVTNVASSGAGTLRSALTNAHDGDVITFAVTGIITNKIAGGLTISNNVSIVGPGADLLTITGTNWFRAFQVGNGATSSISGLRFYFCADAIYNNATLTVSNCVFDTCYRGGGIVNSSNLTVVGCTFTNCRGSYGWTWAGFSEYTPGTAGDPGNNGGAIVNSGTMTAMNCQFLNNFAGFGGDGAPGDVPSFYRSIYQPTTGGAGGSGGHGGAVYDTGSAAFTNCTFSGNTSGGGGSGGVGASGGNTLIYTPDPTYPGPGQNGGNAGNAGNGSAVWSAGGVKLVGCTFYNNFAGPGGNGGNGGNAVMPTPSFYHYNGGNGGYAGHAGNGTLYCTGSCSVIACTFYNNSTGGGGNGGSGGTGVNSAAYITSGGNMGNGANAGNGGSGGAICGPTNTGSMFTLQNVLIAGNACSYAGSPGYAGARVAPGTGPTGTNGLPAIDGTGPDMSGEFTSRSHNFISLGDGSSGFTNGVRYDIVGSGSPLDAMIASLADNHGAVPTCALLPGSPALDAGDDTLLASNIVQDARGYARKSGAHVDIGAFEYQWLTGQFIGRTGLNPDGLLRVSVTNTPGALFTVYGSDDLTLPAIYWPVLGQMTEVSPGQFDWVDLDSIYYEQRFYRLSSP